MNLVPDAKIKRSVSVIQSVTISRTDVHVSINFSCDGAQTTSNAEQSIKRRRQQKLDAPQQTQRNAPRPYYGGGGSSQVQLSFLQSQWCRAANMLCTWLLQDKFITFAFMDYFYTNCTQRTTEAPCWKGYLH
jgi:hypothetical protein